MSTASSPTDVVRFAPALAPDEYNEFDGEQDKSNVMQKAMNAAIRYLLLSEKDHIAVFNKGYILRLAIADLEIRTTTNHSRSNKEAVYIPLLAYIPCHQPANKKSAGTSCTKAITVQVNGSVDADNAGQDISGNSIPCLEKWKTCKQVLDTVLTTS